MTIKNFAIEKEISVRNSFDSGAPSQPSLNLDFANTKELDPRISFSRNSTATYYDGTSAKAEENLFNNSTDYTNSLVSIGASITTTTGVTDPQGGTNAITLSNIAVNEYVFKQSSVIKAKAGETYTASVYIKGTASEIVGVRLFRVDGTIENSTTTLTLDGTWQRVELSLTLQYNHDRLRLDTGRVSGGNASSFSLAFPQMEKRSAATAYTPTTNIPIIKYQPKLITAPVNQPRFDHNPITGESLGLLIEEQRTNLVLSSEIVTASKYKISSIDNTIISPDGTLTADRIVEDTTSGEHFFDNVISVTAGTTYTFSAYYKKDPLSAERYVWHRTALQGINAQTNVNLDTGTISSNGDNASITDVGNGWYRVSHSKTATTTGNAVFRCQILPSAGGSGYLGDGFSGYFVWGIQVEAGAFPTSYIKTTGSTATRSRDVAEMNNIDTSEWFTQGKGTVFVQAKGFNVQLNERFWTLSDGTSNNRIISRPTTGINNILIYNFGGTLQASLSQSITDNTYFKSVLSYAKDNINLSVDGNAVSNDSVAAIPIVDRLNIGSNYIDGNTLNGTIKKLAYYPINLTNNELITLTEEI